MIFQAICYLLNRVPELVVVDAHLAELAHDDVDEGAPRGDPDYLLDHLSPRVLCGSKFPIMTEND